MRTDPYSEILMAPSLWAFAPFLVFVIWISSRVFRKAGHSGLWSLLLLLPGVNVVVVWVFAFVRWPVLDAVKTKRPSGSD